MATPDQTVAEMLGREIDIQIRRLNEELAALQGANARIAEIDAEIAVLRTEKSKIDPRRPPQAVIGSAHAQSAGKTGV